MISPEVERFEILGVKVSAINLSRAWQVIEHWVSSRIKTYVCVAPVSTIVDCQNNDRYREIVNTSGMTTPDGIPVVWLGKLQGHKIVQRTYGPDLLLHVCGLSQKKTFKHYFLGGTQRANDQLRINLKERFSEINIVGGYSPPFSKDGSSETDSIVRAINEADPDILWIGLGSPKQDYWMSENRHRLNVPVMLGVGAAFDFIAGTKPQAPRWMQRSGLEWLFRLATEPRRLWRRYLVGNTIFIYLLCKDLFLRRILKRS